VSDTTTDGAIESEVPGATLTVARAARRRRSDGEQTRSRVLQAAIDSILEKGYYRTSSNEIARRAGVTWGTLQHQFGSREGLLLEVLSDRWSDFEALVATATVEGATLEERLQCLFGVLGSHYARPEQLVQLQILLDLSRDPRTSMETRRAIAVHGSELGRAWRPLFEQALGEAANDERLVRYAFSALRSHLIGHLISTSLADLADLADDTELRSLLVRGVASVIREEMDVGRPGNPALGEPDASPV
jgi:AcrR family transcriptional regulator